MKIIVIYIFAALFSNVMSTFSLRANEATPTCSGSGINSMYCVGFLLGSAVVLPNEMFVNHQDVQELRLLTALGVIPTAGIVLYAKTEDSLAFASGWMSGVFTAYGIRKCRQDAVVASAQPLRVQAAGAVQPQLQYSLYGTHQAAVVLQNQAPALPGGQGNTASISVQSDSSTQRQNDGDLRVQV